MSEYKHPFFDDKGKVVCQVCGKSYLVISPKHLVQHKITHGQYVEKFPDAPLSNTEFAKRGKYGKDKDMFSQPEPLVEDLELDPKFVVDEYDDLEPEIEDLDIQELYRRTVGEELTPMAKTKNRILNLLKMYFEDAKQDYLIRQFRGVDNKLEFEFITDFCDPTLKMVFDFPDTFWHNRDAAIDLNRDLKLKDYGWTVLKFKSNNPSEKDIECILNGL